MRQSWCATCPQFERRRRCCMLFLNWSLVNNWARLNNTLVTLPRSESIAQAFSDANVQPSTLVYAAHWAVAGQGCAVTTVDQLTCTASCPVFNAGHPLCSAKRVGFIEVFLTVQRWSLQFDLPSGQHWSYNDCASFSRNLCMNRVECF